MKHGKKKIFLVTGEKELSPSFQTKETSPTATTLRSAVPKLIQISLLSRLRIGLKNLRKENQYGSNRILSFMD